MSDSVRYQEHLIKIKIEGNPSKKDISKFLKELVGLSVDVYNDNPYYIETKAIKLNKENNDNSKRILSERRC